MDHEEPSVLMLHKARYSLVGLTVEANALWSHQPLTTGRPIWFTDELTVAVRVMCNRTAREYCGEGHGTYLYANMPDTPVDVVTDETTAPRILSNRTMQTMQKLVLQAREAA